MWPCRSAFFIFCSDFRPKIKGENPGLSIGDIAKKLGEMWNSSSAEVKQPYEKKAAKLKEKYDKVSSMFEKLMVSISSIGTDVSLLAFPQDIAAYRTKGIAGLSKKGDGDGDEDEDDEEEEDDDDDEDDDEQISY